VSPIIDNMLMLGCAFAVGETILMLVRTGGGPIVAKVHAARQRIAVAAVVGMSIGAGLGLANIKVFP